MEISFLDKNNTTNVSRFMIKNASYGFLNVLRKYAMSKINTMTIDEVEFSKNDSGLYDEMIALRLGLVPLKADLSLYKRMDECECGGVGCSRCQVEFSLDKKGPCLVYSEDLKFSDPSVKSILDKVVITKLFENQELVMAGVATLGLGSEHSKHIPAHIYYHNVFEIDLSKNDVAFIEKLCPKDSYEIKDNKVLITDMKAYDMYFTNEELTSKVEIKPSETDFILHVESFGQINEADIIKTAITAENSDLDDLNEALLD